MQTSFVYNANERANKRHDWLSYHDRYFFGFLAAIFILC